MLQQDPQTTRSTTHYGHHEPPAQPRKTPLSRPTPNRLWGRPAPSAQLVEPTGAQSQSHQHCPNHRAPLVPPTGSRHPASLLHTQRTTRAPHPGPRHRTLLSRRHLPTTRQTGPLPRDIHTHACLNPHQRKTEPTRSHITGPRHGESTSPRPTYPSRQESLESPTLAATSPAPS